MGLGVTVISQTLLSGVSGPLRSSSFGGSGWVLSCWAHLPAPWPPGLIAEVAGLGLQQAGQWAGRGPPCWTEMMAEGRQPSSPFTFIVDAQTLPQSYFCRLRNGDHFLCFSALLLN